MSNMDTALEQRESATGTTEHMHVKLWVCRTRLPLVSEVTETIFTIIIRRLDFISISLF